MKVGGVLNAAGMPTEEHKRNLDNQITAEITAFESTLMTYVTDNYTPFKVGEDTNLTNCLDDAEAAFTLSFDDQTPQPPTGVYNELNDAYDECYNEMSIFKTKILEVLNEDRQQYVDEAAVQNNIAKTDFLKLIEATIKKLHSTEGLTETEKNDLKDKIYNRRTSFGDRVATWATEVDTES